ncbi:hypothetical protein ElyMa_002030300 [Elysia marginata]|uniref:Uncharacterized protein n=1 Tax=Elysia marginata TaxID=1093978 RepID=A0AAV4F608_9GAST|nr:hypothetical protein ElyMa_002030300 [Elysia marginata]
MPVALEKQPLVPPALRRMRKERIIMCQENMVTSPLLATNLPSDMDQLSLDDCSSFNSTLGCTDSMHGTGSSISLCYQGRSIQGHQVSRLILLNQTTARSEKDQRLSRSTVPGVISQFSQLQARRPLLQRFTVSLANVFGRMCTRRRAVTSSPEVEVKGSEGEVRPDGTDAACRPTDTTGSLRIHKYDCRLSGRDLDTAENSKISDCRLSGLDLDTAKNSTNHSQKTAAEDKSIDKTADNLGHQLIQTYSDIDLDIDLESDQEEIEVIEFDSDKRGQGNSLDPLPDDTEGVEEHGYDDQTCLVSGDHTLSPFSTHRPRKRWTFLSSLGFLPLPLSHTKSCLSQSALHSPPAELEAEDELEETTDVGETGRELNTKRKHVDLDLSKPNVEENRPKVNGKLDCVCLSPSTLC